MEITQEWEKEFEDNFKREDMHRVGYIEMMNYTKVVDFIRTVDQSAYERGREEMAREISENVSELKEYVQFGDNFISKSDVLSIVEQYLKLTE